MGGDDSGNGERSLATVPSEQTRENIDAKASAVIAFDGVFPIIRIFDEAKAREFYLDFLGFSLDWEHRFGDKFPLYAQVSRGALKLHLSGHHGDATPGSTVFVTMTGVRAYHAELVAKNYPFLKPRVEEMPWGEVMEVTDPFGNRIRFSQPPHTTRRN